MKDFFHTLRFKILLCVCVAIAGVMAYAGANGRLRSAPQELLAAAVTPFQKLAAACSDGISGVVDRFLRLDSIVEENETLKEENATLREQLVELDSLRAENEAFRHANKIKEENPNYTFVPGFVIGRDALDQFYSFTIGLGAKQGVKKGDVVVSEYGYLVGIVLDASYTSAKVVTILNPSLNAAGMISRTRDNGVVTGSDELAAEGLCIFTHLSRDTQATVGDQIITTGLGEVFPSNLLVGTIQSIESEATGQSMQAVIQPGVDIANVKQVFVIVDQGEGQPPEATPTPSPSPAPDSSSAAGGAGE